MHLTTAIVIVFFLCYNAIGETGAVTNTWLIIQKNKLDSRIAALIRDSRGRSIPQVGDAMGIRLKRFAPISFTIMVVSLSLTKILPPPFFLLIAMLMFPVLLIGFTSPRSLVKGFKESLRTLSFFIVLFGLACLFTGFGLVDSGWGDKTKELFRLLEQGLGISGMATVIALFLATNLIGWFILRLAALSMVWVLLFIARLSHWLNESSPLRAFYLISQIAFVVFLELIGEALAK